MLLPWGNTTVIEHVVTTFLKAGLEELLIVTGGAQAEVEKAVARHPVRRIYNPDYAAGEMLSSLQCGVRALSERAQAALIGLGDQPQVREGSVRAICEAYQAGKSGLIVPSFQMKRGHPWLVARLLLDEILALKPPETLREFLNRHADVIQYVNLDTASILADLDTPEDYQSSRP